MLTILCVLFPILLLKLTSEPASRGEFSGARDWTGDNEVF